MAAPRWTFIDNVGPTADYEFPVNPSEETEFGIRTSIEHGANTGDTGFVRQQSDDGPLVLRCTGTILHAAQHAAMIQWKKLCKTQTIDLIDHVGDRYEVIISEFIPSRKRTIHNPRDYTNAPYHYWTYEMACEIITVKSGPWLGAV